MAFSADPLDAPEPDTGAPLPMIVRAAACPMSLARGIEP
jgi:hypothetical protein